MAKLLTKRKGYIYLFLASLFLLSLGIFNLNQNKNFLYTENNKTIKTSPVIPGGGQWLDNSNFTGTVDPWFSSIDGDTTDVNPSYTPDQANFEVVGDERTFSEVSGVPTEADWTNITNPLFPALPSNHKIDQYGCWANHSWADPNDPLQSPSIHWERNINLPVDMNDYVITEAFVSAVFNASVTTQSGDNPGETFINLGVDTPNDPNVVTFQSAYEFDYVRFYVLVSDLDFNETYEVAWYQTVHLGQDSPEIDSIADTFMNTVLEETLIFYLTSVLRKDGFNFKITLGMRISCADNFQYDRDYWDSLRIKSCNLTFTYEKRIDKFTSVSWNQEGSKISGNNVYITGANLRFKYKIDQPWPEALSPNSEIKILLNNNSHSETINLNLAITSFQEAKPDGFDVAYLILKDVNITLSIQLYLADDFLYNDTIRVSIDEVFLEISYITIYSELLSEPEIFLLLLILASVAGGAVATYFILYQRILKFPVPVRKVRKYKRTLNKEESPRTSISDSGTLFSKFYNKELNKTSKFLKVKISREVNESFKPLKTKGGEKI